MRWTRKEITAEAADLDRFAEAKLDGARDGDRVANDPKASPTERRIAKAAARTLRSQARDMRQDAAALRDGVDPTELGYTR
ncbi:hypothetical protein ACWGCW_00840 [Streptomyces sp. NPDC054933]